MILITGGLGFIALHAAKRLLDEGQDLVLTQYRVAREPDFIKEYIGRRVFIEQLDVTDADKLLDIGRRYKIDGVVHMAVPGLGALSPEDDYRTNMTGLINVMSAASEWQVKRLCLASSNAVYQGEPRGPFREDMALRMIGQSPTEAFKKSFEVLGYHYGARTGLEVVMLRIAGIYGPLYHSMANLPSRFVHAAIKGVAPELRGETFAEDGNDMCYVKDAGNGIALLAAADTLRYRVYNIGAGRETKNRELAEALRAVFPNAELPLMPGAGPQNRVEAYGDITRIHEDVGYEPQYQVEQAIPDYVEWLRNNPE